MKIPIFLVLAAAALLGVIWLVFAASPSAPDAPQTADSVASARPAFSSDSGISVQPAAPEPAPAKPVASAGFAPTSTAASPQQPSTPTASSTEGDLVPRELQPSDQSGPLSPYASPSRNTPSAATSASTAIAPIQYEIPPGMRAPVVFLPEDRPLTAPIQAALDDIRREFDETIAAANDPADVWGEATRHADDRYRQLMGFDAYNQKTMQDAREAMRSKGLLPEAPTNQP
jgi:hypothetical protein